MESWRLELEQAIDAILNRGMVAMIWEHYITCHHNSWQLTKTVQYLWPQPL